MKTIMKTHLIFFAAIAATLPLHAEDTFWEPATGTIDYGWSNRFNWNRVLPNSGDMVFINNSDISTRPVVNAGAEYAGLRMATSQGDVAHLLLSYGGAMTNFSESCIIGVNGQAHFQQLGGSIFSRRFFILGDQLGSEGFYQMSGGTYECDDWSVRIGNEGYGELKVLGGEFIMAKDDRHNMVGDAPTGVGRVEVYGGLLRSKQVGHFRVGNDGCGSLFVNGGTVQITGDMFVGYANQTQTSVVELRSGLLTAGWGMYVGYGGLGYFIAETNAMCRNLYVGYQASGHGVIRLEDAEITVHDDGQNAIIGDAGYGELVLSNGILRNITGARLTVRDKNTATGIIRGFGSVEGFKYTMINNGVVVADGFGEDQELFFTNNENEFCEVVTNTIPNVSTNGWYARRGGKLTLPPLRMKGGWDHPYTYSWGASQYDSAPDLVNSLRVTVNSLEGGWAFMTASLLAPDRTDVPELPEGSNVLGIWDLRFTGPDSIGDCDLELRYDHTSVLSSAPLIRRYDTVSGKWLRLEAISLPDNRIRIENLQIEHISGNIYSPGLIAALVPREGTFFLLK